MTDTVKVNIPDELFPSLIVGVSGAEYPVKGRTVLMSRDDAHALIGSAMPGNLLPWRAANEQLLQQLGPLPKPTLGIHIAGALTTREAAPRNPRDIGGMAWGIGAPRE